MIHSPQSLADMLERDYFPTTSSLGKNLYLAYDEWRMVIDALRAQRAEAVPQEALVRWMEVMERHSTSDHDGESYNNDDAISAADEMRRYMNKQP